MNDMMPGKGQDTFAGTVPNRVAASGNRVTVRETPLVPPELLNRIVDYFHPRRIVPFGSRARGESGPDSDNDLLVILNDDAPRRISP